MRILVAGAILQTGWPGGEPMVARTLLSGMRAAGHWVEGISYARRGASLASLGASPLDADPVAVAHYCSKIGELKPDLVYGFFDYDSSLAVACRLRSTPFISCVHIHWPACPIGTLYIEGQGVCTGPRIGRCVRHLSTLTPSVRLGSFTNRLPPPFAFGAFLKFRSRRALLSSSAAIIVPSEDARRRIRAAGFARVHAVHNGMDLRPVGPIQPSSRPKIVLFAAGQDIERKGFDDFRSVAERLKPDFPSVIFRATNHRGSDAVEGSPYLTREELQRLMGECYLVVVPVLWDEPFGFVALEAMASGKPVVSYSAGALPEMVSHGETGIVVPRGAVDQLSEAVRSLLLNESVAEEYGAAGRRRAEARFSVERMVRGYLEIGEAVLQQCRTGS